MQVIQFINFSKFYLIFTEIQYNTGYQIRTEWLQTYKGQKYKY